MQILTANIDLSKNDKSKIVDGKNGQKWFPISITILDEPDQYGNNGFITTGQTKEEREAKQNKVYLGNHKISFSKNGTTSGQSTLPQSRPERRPLNPMDFQEDKLPF